jgi:hypothetical protein
MASKISNKLKVASAKTFIDQFQVTASTNVPQDINIAGSFVGSDTDYVTELYEYYLGRTPDSTGLSYWVSVLGASLASRRQIELDPFLQGEGNTINTLYFFSGRPNKWTREYIADANIAGSFSGTNVAYVTQLYNNYFLRDPDDAGLNYWANLVIEAGVSTRRDVEANNFITGEDIYTFRTSDTYDYKYWDEIIALKRIPNLNMKLVVPRHTWTANTRYKFYDNEDMNLYGNAFYIVNSANNVYKCIANNNSVSSVEPTLTTNYVEQYADGYKWKYLYTIESADQIFLTTNYMPVDAEVSVMETATDGSIDHYVVISGGANYVTNSTVTVTVTGDGTGAIATANVVNNVIDKINITNAGTRYRYANVTISDTAGGTGAKVRPIISPQGGHGFDPKTELGAHYVMAHTSLSYGETDFIPHNYRRIGLIKNPTVVTANSVATATTLNGNYSLNLMSNTTLTFSTDEYITGNITGANAFVVYVSSDNKYLRYIQSQDSTSNSKQFQIGERIIGSSSGATGIISTLNQPDVNHDSGEVFFVENIYPAISRSPSQTESFNLVIKF